MTKIALGTASIGSGFGRIFLFAVDRAIAGIPGAWLDARRSPIGSARRRKQQEFATLGRGSGRQDREATAPLVSVSYCLHIIFTRKKPVPVRRDRCRRTENWRNSAAFGGTDFHRAPKRA